MARNSYWVQRQREAERQRRDAVRAARTLERAQQQREREAARQLAYNEKERQRLYLEERAAQAAQLNHELGASVEQLEGLLKASLAVDDALDLESLKQKPAPLEFDPGDLAIPLTPPVEQPPPALGALQKLLPGASAKHAKAVEEAARAHAEAVAVFEQAEQKRQATLTEAREEHDKKVQAEAARVAAQHEEVDVFRASYERGSPEAVVTYCALVLAASEYPDTFPQEHKAAYVPESRQLVLELDLPSFDVVPEMLEFRYVKAKDEIATKARPIGQRKSLYARVVAEVTLRTVHEMFESDRLGHIESVVFNGHVDTIDPRTGQPSRPCLITLRTTREQFDGLDLARVEPQACLQGLNASVSRSPAELAPVRPVLDFNMVDPRFVQETDVLASIDQRPNLMELTPSEFEALITNLFEKMGLETRLTQASRDGGVDCVAYDPRPIFGGKVVIQAKRYKNTVGVSAVRDLFGTMQNEGASKGILVTTSGYGKASFEFADGKPLELLGGGNLLYLLEEHAAIKAKIEPPEDWADPVPDSGEVSQLPVSPQPMAARERPAVPDTPIAVGEDSDDPDASEEVQSGRSRPTAPSGGDSSTEITVKVVLDTHTFDADDGGTLWCNGYTPVDEDGSFLRVSEHQTSDRRCIYCNVAGTSHRTSALQDARFSPGAQIILRPEPENPHDPNAVGVWDHTGTIQAGYVPAELSPQVAASFRKGDPLGGLVLAEFRRDSETGPRVGLHALLAPLGALNLLVED
jgi:restriction system protein